LPFIKPKKVFGQISFDFLYFLLVKCTAKGISKTRNSYTVFINDKNSAPIEMSAQEIDNLRSK